MLLTSTQVIPRSKHEEEDSALLRGKMEELNKNIVRLISETEKLIQESKQLSERIKSFRRKERTTVGARVGPGRDWKRVPAANDDAHSLLETGQ